MSKELKQTFFTSLLVVLLIVSNLIGVKVVSFIGLALPASFITYPFTFLCTLLIFNMQGKKSAINAIIVATLIQVFIVISYQLVVTLKSYPEVVDYSNYIYQVFNVRESNILASLFAFIISHSLLIYLYEYFKKYNSELYGVTVGLLVSLFVDNVIYLLITLRNFDVLVQFNILICSIIMSIIMASIITVLFYLLKEYEECKILKKEAKNETVELPKEEKKVEIKKVVENKDLNPKTNTKKVVAENKNKANTKKVVVKKNYNNKNNNSKNNNNKSTSKGKKQPTGSKKSK